MSAQLAGAVLIVGCVLLFAGCLPTTQTAEPRAPDEPAPQVLQPAEAGTDLEATCGGGQTFPLAALDGPSVERLAGPEFDALRREMAMFAGQAPEFPAADNWRLVARRPDRLLFVADTERGLYYLELAPSGDDWRFSGAGDCNLHLVIAQDAGAAEWWPDPRRPPPTPGSTVLEILVMERACSGGSYATGRIVSPAVFYTGDAITITMGVRPVTGMATCPGNPATPAVLVLPEPIGERKLLDGFHVPPQPPLPPE